MTANIVGTLIGKKESGFLIMINAFFDYSGLRFTIIAIAFLYIKSPQEPLSGFREIKYLNLIS